MREKESEKSSLCTRQKLSRNRSANTLSSRYTFPHLETLLQVRPCFLSVETVVQERINRHGKLKEISKGAQEGLSGREKGLCFAFIWDFLLISCSMSLNRN